MATKQEIIEAIRAGNARVERTFGSLSEERLQTRVHAGEGGWTAKQILAHLAGRQLGYDRMIRMAESGEAPAGGIDVNQWNQQRVDERIGNSRDALLAEFRSVHEGLIERVRSLPDDLLAMPIRFGQMTVSLGDALRGGGGTHSINHTVEVEQALHLPSGG